jgi:uncharacterized protein YceK
MTRTLLVLVVLASLNGCATDGSSTKREHGTVSPVQKPLFEGEEHTGTNTTEDRISPPTT